MESNPARPATTDLGPAAPEDPSSLSPERVKEMRKAIHEHLQRNNTYDQLREIMGTHAAEHIDFNPNNPDDVMALVKERGIVQEVLGRMNAPAVSQRVGQGSRRSLKGLKPGQRYLHVRLLGGRAFLDNVDGDPKILKQQQMVISIHFDRQRLRSSPCDCVCDPSFDDDFLLELNPRAMEDLIDMNIPLHITATKEDVDFYRSRFIGENTVDWRKVLKSGYLSMSIELAGENPGVPAGIVELQLELIPGGRRFVEEKIANTVQHQRSQLTAMDREFLIYARRWWSEYHSLRPTHTERKVKVFAATGTGRSIPVCHFVSPIQPDRVLETPYEAARFVSLMQLDSDGGSDEVLSGAKSSTDNWSSMFSFFCQRRGGSPNHATLLCSLLLGFGLDAYCIVGTDSQGTTRMWIATRVKAGPYTFDVTFWDPTTAQRYPQTGEHPFLTVGCAFNHVQFFGNTQDTDNAVTCDFEFDDDKKWKAMNPIKLKIVQKPPTPPLLWVPLDTRAMEIDTEEALMRSIEDHRHTLNVAVGTHWDRGLSFVLSQALGAYERQRVTLERPDLTQFQQCVKGTLGEGRTFKGFPLNTSHVNVRRILSAISASATGREILELAAEDTHLCIRVRITPFPEGVFSCWIMLAAWYRSLPQ